MSRRPISQREAREFKARAELLEMHLDHLHDRWARSYPGGTNVATLELGPVEAGKVATARLLEHAVVGVLDNDGKTFRLYALPASHGAKA